MFPGNLLKIEYTLKSELNEIIYQFKRQVLLFYFAYFV